MSGLKVDGLALVINGMNSGKTVSLIEHHEQVTFDDGDKWNDVWLISGSDLVNVYYCAQDYVLIKAIYLKPIESKSIDKRLLTIEVLEPSV